MPEKRAVGGKFMIRRALSVKLPLPSVRKTHKLTKNQPEGANIMGIFSSLTAAALEILYFLLGLYIGLLVVGALLSWLVVFDMVSADNRVIRAVNEVYKKLTDPILNPIRRVMPLIGGMDLSPVVLVVAIMFLRAFVWRLF